MAEIHQNEYLSKPMGDAPRLRKEAGATAAEVREFISSLRGKSPEEMLGKVASSNLLRVTLSTTVWTTVLLAIFTLGPYMLKSDAKDVKKPGTKPAVAAKTDAAAEKPKTDAEPDAKADAGKPSDADAQRAAKAMGMDEVKQADPKKNPREKDLDSLLDNVK